MKPRHLIDQIDRHRVETAIHDAELKTSGEIRVVLHEQAAPDALDAARAEFVRLGMEKTNHRNAVLFFVAPVSQTFAVVGDEGVLPDALCKQIIANEITPRFRTGDFTGGVTAGVHGLIAAAKGEYRGSGRTVADDRNKDAGVGLGFGGFVVILFIIGILRAVLRRNSVYSRRGRISPWIFMGGGGGGSSWGGGSSGGGGGSFSGGGGSFGGGGAGGSW